VLRHPRRLAEVQPRQSRMCFQFGAHPVSVLVRLRMPDAVKTPFIDDGRCHVVAIPVSTASDAAQARPAAAHLPVPRERAQLRVDGRSNASPGPADDPELRKAWQRCKTRHGVP